MADSPFQVFWSRRASDSLRGMRDRATPVTLQRIIDLVSQIDERLRTAPTEVGEIYRSRGNISDHVAVRELLAIDFGVDHKNRLVFVRSCTALSGHGL